MLSAFRFSLASHPLFPVVAAGWLIGSGFGPEISAQTAARPPIPTVEAGLEIAVRWRWKVEPSVPAQWGLAVASQQVVSPSSPATSPGGTPQSADPAQPPPQPLGPPSEPVDYVVNRGDSLYAIGRRYAVSVENLKQANNLTKDVIVVGQKLRIPSLAEIQAMAPPPPPPTVRVNPTDTTETAPVPAKPAPPRPRYSRPLNADAARAAHVVLTQSFLDRQLYSAGPIDGSDGPMYEASLRAFKEANPGVLDYEGGQTPAALQELGGAYREYQLRVEDFRWINPAPLGPQSRSSRPASQTPPEPDWESLVSGTFLAYRSAWEFVAERFHCSESFLRRINASLRAAPSPGSVFLVPNVEPFEIETLFDQPLQPQADPNAEVKVSIKNSVILEVRRADQLIARFPVSSARPGLRGKGTWRILTAIPRPALVSTGELSGPQMVTGPDGVVAMTAAPIDPVTIPAGPNNPVGPIWIDLAKGTETTPLPYGLHGTSIPGLMTRQESLGGFRLTNWDIARLVRLLPPETPLLWE